MKFLMPLVRRYAGTVIGWVLTALLGGVIINVTINRVTNNYFGNQNPPIQAPTPVQGPIAKVADPTIVPKDDNTEKRKKIRAKKTNHSTPEEWTYQAPVQNSNSIFNKTPHIITVPVQQPPVYAQQTQSQGSSSYANNTNNIIVQQAPQRRKVIIVQQAPAVRYVPFGFRQRRY